MDKFFILLAQWMKHLIENKSKTKQSFLLVGQTLKEMVERVHFNSSIKR